MAPSKRQHAQHAADRHHHHHPAGRHHSRAPSHKRHPDEPRPRPRAIKLGDVVEVATKHHGFQLALVRRVGADKAHIHWARRSEMVSPDHVVLRHSACRDVSRRSIVRRVHKTARWVFDRAQLAWRDAKQHGCDACAAKAAVSVAREATHVGDLVFLASPTGVYDLALRSNLPSTIRYTGRGPSVKVRRLGRVAELRGVTGHVSERRLYLTDVVERVPASTVVGRGVLNVPGHAESFSCSELLPPGRAHVSRLIAAEPIELRACAPCRAKHERDAADMVEFAQLRLNSTDLYAGGGGSVLGALKAGFSVRHAVDTDQTCIRTLRANEDLRYVGTRYMSVEKYAGEVKRDNLALVFAGPPCQGHSSANRHRHLDDPRNEELWTTLAAIERIRPDVAVIENVRGMKDERESGRESINYAREAVKRLLAMGYQARLALLDARCFGSPQSRVRLFILAARRGIALPSFPAPSHAARVPHTLLRIDGVEERLRLGTGGYGAALPPITTAQAISDMPAFDMWRRPRGFLRPVPYARPPANDFQRRMRVGGELLADHRTEHMRPCDVDAIAAAVNGGGYGADDLHGAFRRADAHGAVGTLLTSARPGGRATGVVHPDQERVFTVAERRRFQGFGDHYRFCGSTRAANKKIGNAVSVEVAEAMCRQIKHDVYFKYWQDNAKPDTKTFWRRWRRAHPVHG